jgi:hypothetical protein
LTALAGAASARQPYRAELAARVAREPARIDPLGPRRAPAPASFLEAVAQRRALAASSLAAPTCDKPFQLVDLGERCSVTVMGEQVRMCKAPLRCIAGMCKRVKEGDFCSTDAMCEGTSSNLDLVCVDNKCQNLLEAGEVCSAASQCFSNQCSQDGRCTGLAEGAPCAYTPSRRDAADIVYQNPCDAGLHCSLRGAKSVCRKSVSLGEPCLGYALPINPSHQPEPPEWFMSAYISAVYDACEAAHVCEVRGFVTTDSSGRGSLTYAGTCRKLLHAPAGSECHSDMVCEPPYSCVDSTCASSPAACGEGASADGGDSAEAEEARAAALLNGCAANERCSCPEGAGECVPVWDECASDERRLVHCMATHGCKWVDAGKTQCAESHCADEDIAFECCKYRAPKFASNVDWEAMAYVYGMDVHDKCQHVVSGTVQGLKHRGERVVLELNGKDDQVIGEDGAFRFTTKLNHLDAFNVTVDQSPPRVACVVRDGSGVALDDVHTVLVLCGDGVPAGARGSGGSAALGVLLPVLLLAGCVGAAALAVGRRNGGGAREGFHILVRGARDLPRSMPAVSVPAFRRGRAGAGGADEAAFTGYFAGSGNDYAGGGYATDPIPQATVIDAATGQPIVRASVVQ